jgi:hypothetical protein
MVVMLKWKWEEMVEAYFKEDHKTFTATDKTANILG